MDEMEALKSADNKHTVSWRKLFVNDCNKNTYR